MKHVFGPVPSRRLGRSLGVDLVAFKTCSYDCIYCQLGRTTCKTVERRDWVSCDLLLEELRHALGSRPDYITLSGSGEPTLHAGLGTLIERIKGLTSIPVAVLTNGSLLWRADVRQELQRADLVIPSLDAGDDLRFQCINRPHESLTFEQMVEGLIAFRREYKGQYWLEVFLLGGYTSVAEEVGKIADVVRRIRPDRVQLNTVTRPPAQAFAAPVPAADLARLAELFEPRAEVIAEHPIAAPQPGAHSAAGDILVMLQRRPCRVEDIMAAHGLHRQEAIKHLDELVRRKAVEPVVVGSYLYYRARHTTADLDIAERTGGFP
jgi:wyosine [tRNA(Phe)-imidazoG37] synthetase (radical SAM superfamily)